VVGAVLHRFDGVVNARIRGQQDDKRVRVGLLDLFEDRESVGVRQAEVEQDEVDALPMTFDRLPGGLGLEDAIPFWVSRSVSDQRISCSSSTTRPVGARMVAQYTVRGARWRGAACEVRVRGAGCKVQGAGCWAV
jgi:hypothetical protein